MVHAYVWTQEQKVKAMRGKGRPMVGPARDAAEAALRERLEAKRKKDEDDHG